MILLGDRVEGDAPGEAIAVPNEVLEQELADAGVRDVVGECAVGISAGAEAGRIQ